MTCFRYPAPRRHFRMPGGCHSSCTRKTHTCREAARPTSPYSPGLEQRLQYGYAARVRRGYRPQFGSPEYEYALRQPIFSFRQSDSFELNGYSVLREQNTRAEGDRRMERASLGHHHKHGQMNVGQRAILELRRVAQGEAMDVVLKPGQLLIFNNRRCLHGRGLVEGKRWIKRIYGGDDRRLVGEDRLIDVWAALSSTRSRPFILRMSRVGGLSGGA